jgi:hypothetical protein
MRQLFGSLAASAASVCPRARAIWIGVDWTIGLVVAATAMIGDLFSSFNLSQSGTVRQQSRAGLDNLSRVSEIDASRVALARARFFGIERDGDAAGQADLPAVRVPAQQQIESRMRSLPVNGSLVESAV